MLLKTKLLHAALASVLLAPFGLQELRAENVPAETGTAFHYIVRTGDTPSGLAKRWGVPKSAFCKPGAKLRVGQTVTIPLLARVRVQSGTSLCALSHKYHRSVETLARFNQIPPPYYLKEGQTVLIPQTGVSDRLSAPRTQP
jgi:LysM repeat protein